MEPTDVVRERAGDGHESMNGVVDYEVVGHTDAVGFHGMALVVVVITN